jgi:osmotically-inducible protein OsmY
LDSLIERNNAMKTDSQLRADVMAELKWDPKVDHSQIGVAAKDGVVTLSGSVPSYAEKIAAEKAARRVIGVKAIAEEIEVRFATDPKTSDAEIAERILHLFSWAATLPSDKLQVKVEKGWVTLTGEVEWQYLSREAQKLAGRITGVKGVTNMIAVKAKPSAADMRERITEAFKRSSLLDAKSLNVVVEGHKVKLSGTVHGWNERRVAEAAAWSAPGVTQVEDNIVLA